MGVVPSAIILGLVALISAGLARLRFSPPEKAKERKVAAITLMVATALQFLHFIEEAMQGFHAAFPAVFGLSPFPYSLFLVFNLGCILMWCVSVVGIRAKNNLAFAAAWFLALAGCLNGLAHPLLALVSGSYFPGLYSSTLLAVACIVLYRSLARATVRRQSQLTV